MKSFTLTAIICLITFATQAQTTRSSMSDSVKTLYRTEALQTLRLDTISRRLKAVADTIQKKQVGATCVICSSDQDLSRFQRILVLIPILSFLVMFGYIMLRLAKEGYKLSDALRENVPQDISNTQEGNAIRDQRLQNAANMQAPPDTVAALVTTVATEPVTDRPQSSSRLIAFLSGMSAILVGVCALTFYIYAYFRTGIEPKLDGLWNIVLGLGVGVVPYAFNKLSLIGSSSK